MRTVSKNEGSLGEKPNFGSKLGGIRWECYSWSFSEHFKSRNLQKVVENGKNDLSYRGSLGESDRRAHISPKMWGLWVTAKTINKNMGSLGDSSAENRGSLEPYIHVTSKMGVAPQIRCQERVDKFKIHLLSFIMCICWIVKEVREGGEGNSVQCLVFWRRPMRGCVRVLSTYCMQNLYSLLTRREDSFAFVPTYQMWEGLQIV